MRSNVLTSFILFTFFTVPSQLLAHAGSTLHLHPHSIVEIIFASLLVGLVIWCLFRLSGGFCDR